MAHVARALPDTAAIIHEHAAHGRGAHFFEMADTRWPLCQEGVPSSYSRAWEPLKGPSLVGLPCLHEYNNPLSAMLES